MEKTLSKNGLQILCQNFRVGRIREYDYDNCTPKTLSAVTIET